MQTSLSDTQLLRRPQLATTKDPTQAIRPFEKNRGTFLRNIIGARKVNKMYSLEQKILGEASSIHLYESAEISIQMYESSECVISVDTAARNANFKINQSDCYLPISR